MFTATQPDTTHVEVATLALRNLYPVGLRKWGMSITVTDDPTPANNLTYELKKGLVDSDKANNSNWQSGTGGFTPTVTSPKVGDTLFFDGSAWVNVGSNNFDTYSKWDWDFSGIGSTNPLGFQIVKSLNAVYSESENYGVDATEKASGVGSLNTVNGTGENIYLSRANYNVGNGSQISIKWRAALEDLSDGTDTYFVYKGLIKPASLPAGATDPNDGIYFKYSHGVNAGKFQAVTIVGGVATTTDTEIDADLVYHVFEIKVNTDLSEVTFYIDGVEVAQHTTNIPTADIYSLILGIWQTAGAAARKIHFDLYGEFIYNPNGR